MSSREVIGSIEPGSIPFGERQQLEEGLTQVLSQAAPTGGPEQAAAAAPVPTPEDPIAALLSGSVDPGAQGPFTSGLSVGPGPGPADTGDPLQSNRAQKLRTIAAQASTPSVRAAARRMLRRLSQGNEPL